MRQSDLPKVMQSASSGLGLEPRSLDLTSGSLISHRPTSFIHSFIHSSVQSINSILVCLSTLFHLTLETIP